MIMDKKLTPRKFDPHEINNHTLQYKLFLTTQQNTNISYNHLGFILVKIKQTSLYALNRIRNQGSHSNA